MATTTKAKGAGMHNPAHPGQILKELYLDPRGISVTDAAAALDVSRKQFSRILNGRSPVTPETAVRLEIVFQTDAVFWLNLQAHYDLWVERQKPAPNVRPFTSAEATRSSR